MTRDTPILRLNRDGYSIEIVVNVAIPGLCAWVLLERNEYGYINRVADGWRLGYDRSCRAAYDAFKLRKADVEARDARKDAS